MRALAYVRVSQKDEEPENQALAIKEWARRNGVEVLGFYVDRDVSGAVNPRERPQYRAMLESAKALGIKLLLFYDLSRLSRKLEDGLQELRRLTDEGFEFKFVAQEFLDYIKDPLLRKKVISDFLWFAELYREDIRRRTIEGLKRARAQGKHIGRPRKNVDLRKVKELRRKGLSYADIARLLGVSYSTLRRRLKEVGWHRV